MAEGLSITRAAINAIGMHTASPDWRLEPQAHAARLPAEAGALKRILMRSDLQGLMDQFSAADSRAGAAQSRYKRFGRLAIMLNAGAVILGALSLAGADILSTFGVEPGDITRSVALSVQYGLIAAALISAQLVIRLRPFETWMKARAAAEMCRLELFETVIRLKEPQKDGELALLPLQLEYFRRYQLGVQLDYYSGRGAQHDRAARGRATRRDMYSLLGALSVAPASAGALSFVSDDWRSRIGGLLETADARLLSEPVIASLLMVSGVIAATLMAAQNALSLLSQDRRNASRYATAFDNLSYLYRTYIDTARQAAVQGDKDAVLEFVGAVHAQISSEHQEWVRIQEESVRPGFDTIAAARLPRLTGVSRSAQEGST
ncbi:DUF4231 domain-containing protein [Hyphomonadaceae bacterium ML37]|nr:DUF4231 domain-containing protein [Hyphomonadaceae bacterium ML37]